MKTRTHFAYRGDVWDDAGDNIVEHVKASRFKLSEGSAEAAGGAGPV